jgi:AGCS family alanine or glycine:cation symporter
MYFSYFGVNIIIFCSFLFGIGTILGNNYNGGQCFAYLMDNKNNQYYVVGATAMVFIGAVAEVKMLWSFMDLILASMAVPHMAALLRQVLKNTSSDLVGSKISI